MRPAQVSEQVFVLLDPNQNNGIDFATAWVVHPWLTPYEINGFCAQTVNVRVLGDGPETLWLTSIALFEERPRPDDLARLYPHNPAGHRTVAFRRHVEF